MLPLAFPYPSLVRMFTTPPKAFAPYRPEYGPLTISMRSMASSGISLTIKNGVPEAFVGIPSTRISVLVAASEPGMPRKMISEGMPSPILTDLLACTPVCVSNRSSIVFAGEAEIMSFDMTLTLAGVSDIRRFVREAVTTILSRLVTLSALFLLPIVSGCAA